MHHKSCHEGLSIHIERAPLKPITAACWMLVLVLSIPAFSQGRSQEPADPYIGMSSKIVELHHGHYIESDLEPSLESGNASPPDSLADWQPFELPYILRGVPNKDRPKHVWFKFELEKPDLILGIYLRRYQTQASVFLNDQRLEGSDTRPGWFTTAWNHPLLVALPESSFKEADNHLYIGLTGGDYGPVMSEPIVGPFLALHRIWENRTFWQVTTSRWAFWLCVTLALVTLWFWLLRRNDHLYLYFAAASASASVVMSYLFVKDYPIGLAPLLVFIHIAVDLSLYFLFAFVNLALDVGSRKLKKMMGRICIVAFPFYVLVPRDFFFPSVYLIHSILLCFLLYILVTGSIRVYRHFHISRIWFPLAFCGIAIIFLHDIYFFALSDTETWIRASNWAQFSIPFILLCLFSYLAQRFVNALQHAETLKGELQTRVRQKEVELEKVFRQELVLERKQSALEEREKIYRDLHDDVGSKLVSIIQSPDEQKNPVLARAALENLRAAIFRAKFPHLTVSTLLADCREETILRAEGLNVQVFWERQGDIGELALPSDSNYHLIRIFREAITNCFQQPDCQYITITVDMTEADLEFTLSNASPPGDVVHSKYGNGLNNIQFRANEIGAKINWSIEGNEMVFRLALPLTVSLQHPARTITIKKHTTLSNR